MPQANPAPQPAPRQGEAKFVQRRSAVRMVIDHPACLQFMTGMAEVRIVDISKGGAKLLLETMLEGGFSGCLKFEGHEVFCKAAWTNGKTCGLAFDQPLSDDALAKILNTATQTFAPIAFAQRIPLGRKRAGRLVYENANEP